MCAGNRLSVYAPPTSFLPIARASHPLLPPCPHQSASCSFKAPWRGTTATKPIYYVSSYFWDRATETGIIGRADAIDWETTPAEFAKHARHTCGKNLDDIARLYPRVVADQAPYFCLDLSFCHTVLTRGFNIHESERIKLVKRVSYNGQAVEAAWPLGAALNALGGMH